MTTDNNKANTDTTSNKHRSQVVVAPAAFLCDSGLLYEINRTVLHPLGLALSVIVPDPNDPEEEDRAGKAPLRAYLYKTEDPEGYIFEEEDALDGEERLRRTTEEASTTIECRHNRLGYVIQKVTCRKEEG